MTNGRVGVIIIIIIVDIDRERNTRYFEAEKKFHYSESPSYPIYTGLRII